MKNSIDTIGNITRDLPACSAVSQPTAPPHTPQKGGKVNKYNCEDLRSVMSLTFPPAYQSTEAKE